MFDYFTHIMQIRGKVRLFSTRSNIELLVFLHHIDDSVLIYDNRMYNAIYTL